MSFDFGVYVFYLVQIYSVFESFIGIIRIDNEYCVMLNVVGLENKHNEH